MTDASTHDRVVCVQTYVILSVSMYVSVLGDTCTFISLFLCMKDDIDIARASLTRSIVIPPNEQSGFDAVYTYFASTGLYYLSACLN